MLCYIECTQYVIYNYVGPTQATFKLSRRQAGQECPSQMHRQPENMVPPTQSIGQDRRGIKLTYTYVSVIRRQGQSLKPRQPKHYNEVPTIYGHSAARVHQSAQPVGLCTVNLNYWYCPHSTFSRVYVAYLSGVRLRTWRPLLRVCCYGPSGQEISIACCTTGGHSATNAGSATLSADVGS